MAPFNKRFFRLHDDLLFTIITFRQSITTIYHVNIAPLPHREDLLQVAPEDFLDRACDRISNVAKGALLLVAGAFTAYNGCLFYYTISTKPVANTLAMHAIGFAGGTVACCMIQSYLPHCCSQER